MRSRLTYIHPWQLLLRVSDPVMLEAVRTLRALRGLISGQALQSMEICYDEYKSYCAAAGSGVDCPTTRLASQSERNAFSARTRTQARIQFDQHAPSSRRPDPGPQTNRRPTRAATRAPLGLTVALYAR